MLSKTFFTLALVSCAICVVSSRSINFHDTDDDDEIQFSPSRERERISKDFRCPGNGLYPHPESCQHFFECRSGRANLKQCSRHNLFDEKKQHCVDKKKVHCHRGHKDSGSGSGSRERGSGSGSSEERDNGKEFRCPETWGSFPDPRDCTKYYVCLYGVPTSYKCHKPELFDEKVRKCLPKHKVNCGHRKDKDDSKTSKRPKTSTTEKMVTTTTVSTTTNAPNRFSCPSPNGRYADPRDCSRYYECRNGSPSHKQCKRSELYDERREKCQNKRDVRCGDRGRDLVTTEGTSKGEETTTEKITKTEEITTEDTSTNEPTTSTEVTNEQTTTEEIISTPEETTIEVVVTEEETTTEAVVTEEETTTEAVVTEAETTTEAVVTEAETTTEVVVTKEETVSEDVFTGEESTTKGTTSDDRITSTTLKPTLPNTPPPTDCDEDDIDCIIDETGDVTGWFACPDRYGHFPHGSSKKLFIHCDNWKPFVKTCADNTEFSPIHLVCIWA